MDNQSVASGRFYRGLSIAFSLASAFWLCLFAAASKLHPHLLHLAVQSVHHAVSAIRQSNTALVG